MSAVDILAGRRVLVEIDSPYNGKITVVRELIWGTYIKAGGLPQSGGLAKDIWKKSLKTVRKLTKNSPPKTILILGFGGGGIAQIVRTFWPKCRIYGVDIDPDMVRLGREHLGWEKTNSEVYIIDANVFIDRLLSNKVDDLKPLVGKNSLVTKFDLVCVDMYVGDGVPEKFNSAHFAKKVKDITKEGGIAVFNRLYGSDNREAAYGFKKKLDKVFPDIVTVYPEANVMYICRI